MSYFIANLSLNLLVKEFLKSVNNLAKLQAKCLIVSHIPFARVVEFGTVRSDFVASRSGRVAFLNSTARTHELCLRPDQTRPTNMSRLSRQVYDQTKCADLSETQAVRGSGRVGSMWWNLEATLSDPTNDKVWSGPSGRMWTLAANDGGMHEIVSRHS